MAVHPILTALLLYAVIPPLTAAHLITARAPPTTTVLTISYPPPNGLDLRSFDASIVSANPSLTVYFASRARERDGMTGYFTHGPSTWELRLTETSTVGGERTGAFVIATQACVVPSAQDLAECTTSSKAGWYEFVPASGTVMSLTAKTVERNLVAGSQAPLTVTAGVEKLVGAPSTAVTTTRTTPATQSTTPVTSSDDSSKQSSTAPIKLGVGLGIGGPLVIGIVICVLVAKRRMQRRRNRLEEAYNEDKVVDEPKGGEELKVKDEPDVPTRLEFRSELPADAIVLNKSYGSAPAELGDEGAVGELEPHHIVELDDSSRMEIGSQGSASPQEMEDNAVAPRIELKLPSEDEGFQAEFLDIKVDDHPT